MKQITLYSANCRQNKYNTNYPNKQTITTEEQLKAAVKFDHIAIAADQKALAEKEGRVYVDPHLKMMLDEAEYVLKAKCEAENLNFDQEWAGKQAEVTEKYQAEKAKKEEKEAKRSNPAKDAETLKEFNEIRVKNGRPPISM